MNKRILFVSHKKARCGVYEFGKSITDVLQRSRRYQFIRAECSSLSELQTAITENAPTAIIYNYMPSVLPWVATRIAPRLFKSNIASVPIPQIGIIHDITQRVADSAVNYRKKLLLCRSSGLVNSLFDVYIGPDPTLLLLNPLVYKTGRLLPRYQNNFPLPSKPVIGSFGFGTPNKGFEKIIQLVQQEYDEADIRFNIPFAEFGDRQGVNARAVAARCKALITKPGIRLHITHDYMDNKTLLDFLANNTVNIFLYEDKSNRGLSSALDNAMAVQRPVAVSDGVMFRHVFDIEPSVCITNNSLKTIIHNGFAPLEKHYNEWTDENLLWEYERILGSIFAKLQQPVRHKTGIINTLRAKCRRMLSIPDSTFTWLRSSDKVSEDDMTTDRSMRYQPVQIPAGTSLNRILDDNARQLYAPAVAKLKELAPKTMSKKIERANVQQAFVFDTVYRYLSQYKNPKLLCVGCYEDTASMGLKKMGYAIGEIDPMINYTLQEYFTKPTTRKNSYDIIFSTSVIEHDPDDESFIRCISDLLAPGGIAIITCDYKDGWKPGELKPEVDVRLYTKRDLINRLLPLMGDCRLVDEPQWDCPKPDFNLLGKYQYTFAGLVVKRNRRQ
ncbi:MAG: methyltransferase domain-containing protein [Sedimentisphaerales bacterium]|nr:methyltransferase domain-containing protein [Sedimentisphaerales bacterium]